MSVSMSNWPLYHYRATVRRVIDGDTIEVLLDHGDHLFKVRRLRLLGYDAPELFSGNNREAGKTSRDALEAMLGTGTIYIETKLDKTSFDRLLAWAYLPGNGDEMLDVAEAMIAGGYGVRA